MQGVKKLQRGGGGERDILLCMLGKGRVKLHVSTGGGAFSLRVSASRNTDGGANFGPSV